MLLFREKVPATWLPSLKGDLGEMLIDHAHLERKAATTSINLEKYSQLFEYIEQLNAIAIEELQHFQMVLDLLKKRNIPFGAARKSHWISGMMQHVRKGQRHQVIDHLVCFSLIEGRSCEKFQILSRELVSVDPDLAQFYGSLVESEGNHYATYILMARKVDDRETDKRLDYFLDLEAKLIREAPVTPILHP